MVTGTSTSEYDLRDYRPVSVMRKPINVEAPEFREQVPLSGHAKIDLLVADAAIEVKAGGSFGSDARKYGTHRAIVDSGTSRYHSSPVGIP